MASLHVIFMFTKLDFLCASKQKKKRPEDSLNFNRKPGKNITECMFLPYLLPAQCVFLVLMGKYHLKHTHRDRDNPTTFIPRMMLLLRRR